MKINIEGHLALVLSIAKRIAARLPANIELDDLISSGVIGLMDAIEKYDPMRDNKFKTYAEFRIRGAILDELRAQDWVPRSVRDDVDNESAIFELVYYDTWEDFPLAAMDDPERAYNEACIKTLLQLEISRLSKIPRNVILGYYYQGFNLKDMAKTLRVSEVRTSQIRLSGIKALRAGLQTTPISNSYGK